MEIVCTLISAALGQKWTIFVVHVYNLYIFVPDSCL